MKSMEENAVRHADAGLALAALSHDLRTPVTSMIALTQLALEAHRQGQGVEGCLMQILAAARTLEAITGDLTAGQLSIFTSLSWALSNPVNNLGPLLNDYQRFFASANKIIEVYYSRPLIADRTDAVSHPHTEGRVEFSHVS